MEEGSQLLVATQAGGHLVDERDSYQLKAIESEEDPANETVTSS